MSDKSNAQIINIQPQLPFHLSKSFSITKLDKMNSNNKELNYYILIKTASYSYSICYFC